MVIAEKQYQEKMAEFGRLEFEAKMVTIRMRELEGRMNGLDSNTDSNKISNDTNNSNRVEGYESISRKSSYQSESKSLSMQKSRHYESSEGECSNEYYSQSKRRQKHTSDEMESKMFSGKKSSRRADTHEISAKRVKVRCRQDGRNSRSSYGDSEIHVESSSSRRSEKFDRHRTERFSAPEKHGSYDRYSPGTKKRSKSANRTPSFSKERPAPASGSRESRSKRKQKSQHLGSDVDDASCPRKPVAHHQAEGYSEKDRRSPGKPHRDRRSEGSYDDASFSSRKAAAHHQAQGYSEEESRPRSRRPPSKSRDRRSEDSNDSKTPTDERRGIPTNVVLVMNEELADDDNDSDTASTKLPAGVQEGDETKEGEGTTVLNTKNSNASGGGSAQQQQVNPTRDPLYWLAGGENSSDDESWDFDGPMILPPPPL